MIVVAHAQSDETRAIIAHDRARRRLQLVEATIAEFAVHFGPVRARRRYVRASCALHHAGRTLVAATRRHTTWYRAFVEVRSARHRFHN